MRAAAPLHSAAAFDAEAADRAGVHSAQARMAHAEGQMHAQGPAHLLKMLPGEKRAVPLAVAAGAPKLHVRLWKFSCPQRETG